MKQKHYAALLCLIAVLAFLPVCALALTQEEWDQWSYNKTSRTTTLYAIENGELATSTDLAGLQAIGSLPAGTYIRTGSSNRALGMKKITYYAGGQASAWVYADCITDASRVLTFTDGISITLPEALVNNTSALKAFLRETWPDKTLPGLDSADNTGSQGSSFSSSSSKKYSSAPKVARKDYTGPHIKQLGLLTAIIRENHENSEVPTSSLVLQSVESDHQLAVIHAPKTGKCTMREKPSKKSDMVKNCKAGRIAIVLEVGKEYTRILYNNAEGYVLTSCLKFYTTDTPTLGAGVLSWEGKATGRTKINVRSAPEKSAKKVGEWKTGTTVTVFSLSEGWYEIEYKGEHGYVMEQYLTLQE